LTCVRLCALLDAVVPLGAEWRAHLAFVPSIPKLEESHSYDRIAKVLQSLGIGLLKGHLSSQSRALLEAAILALRASVAYARRHMRLKQTKPKMKAATSIDAYASVILSLDQLQCCYTKKHALPELLRTAEDALTLGYECAHLHQSHELL
jgi:hypothetical protein